MIVSPDAGGVARVKQFMDGLRHEMEDVTMAMIIKQRTAPVL